MRNRKYGAKMKHRERGDHENGEDRKNVDGKIDLRYIYI